MRDAFPSEPSPAPQGREAGSYLLLRRPLGGADLREEADAGERSPRTKVPARPAPARPPARTMPGRVTSAASRRRVRISHPDPPAAERSRAPRPGPPRARPPPPQVPGRLQGPARPRPAAGLHLAGRAAGRAAQGACAGRGPRSPSSWASWRRGGRVPGACGPRRAESLCEPGLLGSDRSSRRPSCWDPRRGRWENRMEPDWKPASSSPRVPRPRAPPPRRPGRPQPLPIGYGAHPAAGRFRNR